MDCNVSNNMTGRSIILPLATIEEDIDEIDDKVDESLEYNINNIIDNNGKRIFLSKFERFCIQIIKSIMYFVVIKKIRTKIDFLSC
jgi:hypothetical protein